jgi:DNA-3-methyladenine glycosylase
MPGSTSTSASTTASRATAAEPPGAPLGAGFFARDTLVVARDLLGKLLVREVAGRRRWGRLVEVEAYLGPDDLAAHSARGRLTPRTRVMYGPPGQAYVYLIYGLHHCLNFVTADEGVPHAILVRALEPGPGVGRCAGPGLVCRSLEIDRTLNGRRLAPPDLYVADDGVRVDDADVVTGPRVGVAYAGEWALKPWRFSVAGSAATRRGPR